jgi:hypothetical protein
LIVPQRIPSELLVAVDREDLPDFPESGDVGLLKASDELDFECGDAKEDMDIGDSGDAPVAAHWDRLTGVAGSTSLSAFSGLRSIPALNQDSRVGASAANLLSKILLR